MQHQGSLAYGKLVIYDGYFIHFNIVRRFSISELLRNGSFSTMCLHEPNTYYDPNAGYSNI